MTKIIAVIGPGAIGQAIARWGGPRPIEEIRPGDVVWFAVVPLATVFDVERRVEDRARAAIGGGS
jgi:hypothetical protein